MHERTNERTNEATAMPPCAVPECPAQAASNSRTCAIHRYARLAKGITADGKVLSHLRCRDCKRGLRAADWVFDEPGQIPRHVRCEPKIPRRRMKDEPKPLLEDA